MYESNVNDSSVFQFIQIQRISRFFLRWFCRRIEHIEEIQILHETFSAR